MNELLGWYGYDNVDRNDLSRCGGGVASTLNPPQQPLHLTTTTPAISSPTPRASVANTPRTAVTTAERRNPHTGLSPSAATRPAAPQQLSAGGRAVVTTPDHRSPDSSPAENRSGHSSPSRLLAGGSMMGTQQHLGSSGAATHVAEDKCGMYWVLRIMRTYLRAMWHFYACLMEYMQRSHTGDIVIIRSKNSVH